MNKKAILAIANVLYILVVTKSYKKSYVHQDHWILANFSYVTIDKKVTYIFLKRPKIAFRGKILKI